MPLRDPENNVPRFTLTFAALAAALAVVAGVVWLFRNALKDEQHSGEPMSIGAIKGFLFTRPDLTLPPKEEVEGKVEEEEEVVVEGKAQGKAEEVPKSVREILPGLYWSNEELTSEVYLYVSIYRISDGNLLKFPKKYKKSKKNP